MHIDIQPTGGLLSIPTEKIESEKNESDGIESEKIESWTRRKFVQVGSACAASLGLGSRALAYSAPQTAASMVDVPYDKREPRIAFIGVGGRGTSLLKNVLAAQGKIVNICDIVAEKADAASALVVAAGQPKPSTYTDGDHAYEKLLEEKNIDFVDCGDAVGVACADGAGFDEGGQGCRYRSAGRGDAGGLLEDCRHL